MNYALEWDHTLVSKVLDKFEDSDYQVRSSNFVDGKCAEVHVDIGRTDSSYRTYLLTSYDPVVALKPIALYVLSEETPPSRYNDIINYLESLREELLDKRRRLRDV